MPNGLKTAALLVARQQQKKLDQLDLYQAQMQVLQQLLNFSLGSRFAREHALHRQMSWTEFQTQVPLRAYDAYRLSYIEPHLTQLERVLSNQPVRWLGKTSGTSAGREKLIPLTPIFMHQNQQAAQLQALFNLLAVPEIALFKPIFWLTDLSDLDQIGPYPAATTARLMRAIGPTLLNNKVLPRAALFESQPADQRFEKLIKEAGNSDICFIAGVSPWLITLFKRLLELHQSPSLTAIWPHLKLVGHAGVCFDWYAETMRELTGPGVTFRESYAGTEGFYGFQDLHSSALRFIPHLGLLYEFVKREDYQSQQPRRYGLWELEAGQTYVLYISNSCGLWSFEVGDLVRIERAQPFPLFRVIGRVHAKFDFLGDKLLLQEIEQALMALEAEQGFRLNHYHVGIDMVQRQMHLLLDFARPPAALGTFLADFDRRLQFSNDQYRRNRQGGVNRQPKASLLYPDGFQNWLQQARANQLQSKIPQLFAEPAQFAAFYQELLDLDLIVAQKC